MVPIHQSDVAEERWNKAEWENYELWERVEVRLKRQKQFWVFGTLFLSLCLSAVPIAMDRWPKWKTRSYARLLAQELNQVKRDAGIEHAPFRMSVSDVHPLELIVERVSACSDAHGEVIRTISLGQDSSQTGQAFAFLSANEGSVMGIPGIVKSFCYDHLMGSDAAVKGEGLVGFGIIPAQDIAGQRIDRATLLLLSGPSAEMMFD